MIKHPSDNLKRGQARDLQFFYTLTNNWLLMGNRTNRKPEPDLDLLSRSRLFHNGPSGLAILGGDIGVERKLEIDYPGRTFVVIPVGALDRPPAVKVDIDPDYQKFDRALKTQVRPVLVPLQRLPFRDLTAEEFLGGQVVKCRPGAGCVSIFKDSALTLGQMGDALVYFGKP